jgi:hypothetical protein
METFDRIERTNGSSLKVSPLVKFIDTWVSLYDKLEKKWHHLQHSKFTSNLIVVFFFIGIAVSLLSHFHFINIIVGRFFAIELAFGVLLFIEIFDLVFLLTHSVADSVGKQFEIVSLLLLRSSFKELGHLPLEITWDQSTLSALVPLITDALGAVFIFLITILFYKQQRHLKITKNEAERLVFIRQKKVVASIILVILFISGIYTALSYFKNGEMINFFHTYYTVLIFSDILILILSLRYSNQYIHLFRYSSFALATVIIRFSLSASKYFNVLLSVSAGLFVLAITYVYNFLNKNVPEDLE